MNLKDRIARLELMAHGEGEQASLPGLTQIIGHDRAVTACAFQPPGPITSGVAGMIALWGRGEWRSRDTCPDAGECPHAATCRADGTQRRIANPLVP